VLLAHQLVQHESAAPEHWVVFLHGVLGRGANWQGFARRLVTARPELGALLVDLRMHGESQSRDAVGGVQQGLPPPHTFEAATRDVLELLDAALHQPLLAVVGHSFGGKVTLELLAQRPQLAREAWVLDASPSPRGERGEQDSTQRVFDALRSLPATFESRNAFTDALSASGIAPALGMWLAKNLVREGATLRFGLDLDAIAQLLADHDRQDLWSVVESPERTAKLRFVLGGRSTTIRPDDRARLEELATRSVIELMELPEAGHWVHTDDPDGLLALLEQRLDR
jgi:esterase